MPQEPSNEIEAVKKLRSDLEFARSQAKDGQECAVITDAQTVGVVLIEIETLDRLNRQYFGQLHKKKADNEPPLHIDTHTKPSWLLRALAPLFAQQKPQIIKALKEESSDVGGFAYTPGNYVHENGDLLEQTEYYALCAQQLAWPDKDN